MRKFIPKLSLLSLTAFLVSFIIFSVLIFRFSTLTQALTPAELNEQLQDKEKEIIKYQNQLNEAQKQEKTLKSQLNIIDGQARVTQLKIEETNLQITKLEREISDLSSRITRLSGTLDSISQVLLNRIVQTYKHGRVSTIDLIFSSNGFSDLLERLKYLEVAQANDKKVLYQLQATKNAYNDQKLDKEQRQKKAEDLKKQLSNYNTQLKDQKKAKEDLIRITKNDEAKYQGLIAQLQAELSSIAQAISNIGAKIGPVNKGDTIAAMGSTGCSTGPHLHFEVFENAEVKNNAIVIKGTNTRPSPVNPRNYLDNGKLGSPLSGFPGGDWVITTGYGDVYKIFGFPSTHTGLDIAPQGGGGLGRPIYAADKGISYSTQAICSYNISGGSSLGKGVIVDHENGIVTLYWHIL